MAQVTKLESKDITQIREATLPEAISASGKSPDTNFFSKVSTWFTDFAKATAKSQGFWASFFKGTTLGGLVVSGAAIGSKLGAFLGLPGAIAGGALGAGAGALAWAWAGMVFQGNNPVAPVKQTLDVVDKTAKTLGSLALTKIIADLTGTTIPQLAQGLLNFGEMVYEFNWDIPDSQIWSQINSIIDGLYSQAGQFLGSSFMRFLITGTIAPPRVQIDIRGIAVAYCDYSEAKRKQLLDGVSNFAWQGINAAKRIAFLFAFLSGRNAIKQAILMMPNIEDLAPDLYKRANEWGDEEKPNTPESEVKDWRISTWVEKKVDSIGDPRIKSFVEGFLEGAHDVIEDDIMDYFELKYA